MYLRWTKAELHLRIKGQDRIIRRTAYHKRGLRTQEGTFKIKQESAGLKFAVVELGWTGSWKLTSFIWECHFLRTSQTHLGATVTSSSQVSSFPFFEPERFQNQPNGSSKKSLQPHSQRSHVELDRIPTGSHLDNKIPTLEFTLHQSALMTVCPHISTHVITRLSSIHPPSIPASNHPSRHSSIHPNIHPSTYPSTHPLSIHLSTHPSFHPLNYPSIHSSIHPNIQPSTHPSISLLILPLIHPFIIYSYIHPSSQPAISLPSLSHPSIHSSSLHSSFHPSWNCKLQWHLVRMEWKWNESTKKCYCKFLKTCFNTFFNTSSIFYILQSNEGCTGASAISHFGRGPWGSTIFGSELAQWATTIRLDVCGSQGSDFDLQGVKVTGNTATSCPQYERTEITDFSANMAKAVWELQLSIT